MRIVLLSLCLASLACSRPTPPAASQTNAGIDSLNARLVNAYRTHDAKAYAALFTDSAVFEWPAFNTVRGPAELEAMARSNWVGLKDMDLKLTVANRRLAPDHATELGAFQQSWNDSSGTRMTEFGRYVAVLVPHPDGAWRMDRFFGFSDSTRPAAIRP
jgi:ketosteroid isomerase-like protein